MLGLLQNKSSVSDIKNADKLTFHFIVKSFILH